MKLPEQFLENIKKILPENEFDDFLASYDEERFFGIRANTLRIDPKDFKKATEGTVNIINNVPWCETGFYYEDSQPGQSPLYHAGVYYIQEPSAMYPGGNVPLKDGDFVLDLCAAPGGKSTQLAARLNGTGLLVSNDINEERTKALVKNLQMCGAKNAVVTNETPENLARNFRDFFDVIVVDAPCSGEGMFRKDEEAVSQWENYKKERCRKMQDEILENADKMLKMGGILSYSTCTFNTYENEESLSCFMEKHPEYYLIDAPKIGGIEPGLSKYDGFEKAARLWPHKLSGEGHFTAFLKKGEAEEKNEEPETPKKKNKKQKFDSFRTLSEPPAELREYYEYYMTTEPFSGTYFTMGNNIYYLPVMPPNIDGLKVPMAGVHMGTIEHGTFKPSHRLALTLTPDDFVCSIVFDPKSDAVTRYLKGETISIDDDTEIVIYGNKTKPETVIAENYKSPCAISVKAGDKSFVLGLGQLQGGTIKNLYPKGWRRFN